MFVKHVPGAAAERPDESAKVCGRVVPPGNVDVSVLCRNREGVPLQRRDVNSRTPRPVAVTQVDARLPRRRRGDKRHDAAEGLRKDVRHLVCGEEDGLRRVGRHNDLRLRRRDSDVAVRPHDAGRARDGEREPARNPPSRGTCATARRPAPRRPRLAFLPASPHVRTSRMRPFPKNCICHVLSPLV